MEFTPLTTFEITEEVAKKFLDYDSFQMPNAFPFNEFAVSFPISALCPDNGFNSLLFDKIKSKPKNVQNKIDEFLRSNITIFIKEEKDDTISITIHDSISTSVEACFSNGDFNITKQLYADEYSMAMLAQCLHITQGVIWHYTSPITVKKAYHLRERKNESKIKGYNSPSKKYLYRTLYVFENADRNITNERKEFNRKTDSWMVSGHVRKYRDSDGNIIKEVYINPYKKGSGALKNTQYKITRV